MRYVCMLLIWYTKGEEEEVEEGSNDFFRDEKTAICEVLVYH